MLKKYIKKQSIRNSLQITKKRQFKLKKKKYPRTMESNFVKNLQKKKKIGKLGDINMFPHISKANGVKNI